MRFPPVLIAPREFQVVLWTDGSCANREGFCPGGWAFRLVINDVVVLERSGPVIGPTTSQRMEMQAALEGLKALWEHPTWSRSSVAPMVRSDSKYLVNCFKQRWYRNWTKNGWVNYAGKPVANRDMWESLLYYHANLGPSWTHVKGHRGILHNEACDVAAKTARKSVAAP